MKRGEHLHKHGMSGSREYLSWTAMKARCLNPNSTGYEYYGGRGIRVCERWLSFGNFYADLGRRPPGMTLDRIDSNGNYEPGNVRWADKYLQARDGLVALKRYREKRLHGLYFRKCMARWTRFGRLYTLRDLYRICGDISAALEESFGPTRNIEPHELGAMALTVDSCFWDDSPFPGVQVIAEPPYGKVWPLRPGRRRKARRRRSESVLHQEAA